MVVQLDRLIADPSVNFFNEVSIFGEFLDFRKILLMLERSDEGNGCGVVVVHGFLAFDNSTWLLRTYLENHGYRVFGSGIGINAICLNNALNTLIKECEEAVRQTGQKIIGIGHSLGGMIVRAAATKRPDLFRQVILLGSPISSIRVTPQIFLAHGLVANVLAASSGCAYDLECGCGAVTAFRNPFPKEVDHHSIYTKTDGVVKWLCCLEEDRLRNHQVRSSHSGLPWNSQVLRLVRTLTRNHANIA